MADVEVKDNSKVVGSSFSSQDCLISSPDTGSSSICNRPYHFPKNRGSKLIPRNTLALEMLDRLGVKPFLHGYQSKVIVRITYVR